MKNCIIIHWCPSNIEKAMNPETRTYDKHWIPWLKQELIKNGIKTDIPLMPEPWYPDYNKFKKEFEKLDVDKNTILVGHSCGCAFLVRWLGEIKQKVSKLILVAPWKVPEKDDGFQEKFYIYDIDETIKNRVSEIIMFTSNDEEKDWKKSLEIFHKALGWEIIELPNHGHYCLKNMKTEQFPELLEKILT